MPLLRAINSAITRASTLSFIVTPHWLEMVCSKRTSFIDLQILSLCTDLAYSCSRLSREVGPSTEPENRQAWSADGKPRPISLAIISARSIDLFRQSLNCAVFTCGIDQIGCNCLAAAAASAPCLSSHWPNSFRLASP